MFPLGFTGSWLLLPGDPYALSKNPSPAEHLSWGEGTGMQGGSGRGEQQTGRMGRFGSPAWNGQGTGSKWHKTAP